MRFLCKHQHKRCAALVIVTKKMNKYDQRAELRMNMIPLENVGWKFRSHKQTYNIDIRMLFQHLKAIMMAIQMLRLRFNDENTNRDLTTADRLWILVHICCVFGLDPLWRLFALSTMYLPMLNSRHHDGAGAKEWKDSLKPENKYSSNWFEFISVRIYWTCSVNAISC